MGVRVWVHPVLPKFVRLRAERENVHDAASEGSARRSSDVFCKEQLFHAFWGTGTLRDSEWMCIDSFRATQRSCARLIVWFGKKAALEEHATKHAAALDPARRPAVEFRLLDVAAVRELARGSAVAHYSEVQLREIKDQQRLGMSQW